MPFFRHFKLIPSWSQWKGWSLPSKLTAIGTLLGLIGILLSLTPLPNYIFESRRQAIADIKITLKKVAEEIRVKQTFENSFQINPDFRSQKSAIDTLEVINKYLENSIFDVASVDRIIKEYGSDKLKNKFSTKLNQAHYDAKELSLFLVGIINSKDPFNKDELNNTYNKFTVLMSKVASSQAALRGFVTTLTPKDFGY